MNKYDRYLIFDDPIPYKDLLLYPVKIRDYMLLLTLASCLMLEKNSIRDPVLAVKAISMSYLEYLFFVANPENQLISLFAGLLGLVLGKKEDKDFIINYWFDKNGKPFFKIDSTIYNSDDFDQIREIIAEQNGLELPNEKIQKDVRDKMEEARRFKQRMNKSKSASFEEQIVALSLYSGIDLEKLYNITVRKFVMMIRRTNHMIMSNIYLTASMSGFVTFKSKDILRPWIADLEEEDKYSDVKIDLEDMKKKINSGGNNAKA